jgi:hypothetical protein
MAPTQSRLSQKHCKFVDLLVPDLLRLEAKQSRRRILGSPKSLTEGKPRSVIIFIAADGIHPREIDEGAIVSTAPLGLDHIPSRGVWAR